MLRVPSSLLLEHLLGFGESTMADILPHILNVREWQQVWLCLNYLLFFCSCLLLGEGLRDWSFLNTNYTFI